MTDSERNAAREAAKQKVREAEHELARTGGRRRFVAGFIRNPESDESSPEVQAAKARAALGQREIAAALAKQDAANVESGL